MSKRTMQYSDYTVSHISSTNRDDASYARPISCHVASLPSQEPQQLL